MSDASSHPRRLDLPRDEDRLATSDRALRRVRELLKSFLDETVAEADANGVVVVLDGTVGSTVVAALAADAVGPDRVRALVTTTGLSDEAAARDAEAVASALGVDHRRLQLQPVVTAFQRVVGTAGEPADDIVAVRNAHERFRMACAYYVANVTGTLVLGTVTRTERLLGSVAKHGRNAVDLAVLGDLYRTEVAALAEYMDAPTDIAASASDGDRLGTPSDAERLGVAPRTLDSLLRRYVDEGDDEATVADRAGVDRETVRTVADWCATTRHKRHEPPKPSMRT